MVEVFGNLGDHAQDSLVQTLKYVMAKTMIAMAKLTRMVFVVYVIQVIRKLLNVETVLVLVQ